MSNIMLEQEYIRTQEVYKLLDNNQLDDAIKLTLEIEKNSGNYSTEKEQYLCRQYVASCLIDVGEAVKDENMIRRGIAYFVDWQDKFVLDKDKAHGFYNIANGYICCWNLQSKQNLQDGIDSKDYVAALKYYRMAIEHLQSSHTDDGLVSQLWTNYGNALDYVSRFAEAVDAFDSALKVNPQMGMAAGNKAIALINTAPFVSGYSHRFYIESKRLLEISLRDNLYPHARYGFNNKLIWLQEFINAHGEMIPEEIEPLSPINKFHNFLCEFCAKQGLFLSPLTLLGEDNQIFYGDPMFIDRMNIPITDGHRADRYSTFLNEIKQDYVLGRYFLVQSQYQSDDLNAVDEGVMLIYPLDYSLHSVYIQFLKAAMKQAISVLDKVAYFIYDYCGLSTPPSDRVTFRQLFGGNEKMRSDLNMIQNKYLFALFSLSREVSKDGYWKEIFEDRDALTHRFLVLHEMKLTEQPNKDIPRELESEFRKKVILATKIARAAVMYLIMFVATEENKTLANFKGNFMTMPAVPLDKKFRHRPSN